MHLAKILKGVQRTMILSSLLLMSQAAWCQVTAEDALFQQMNASERAFVIGSQVTLLQAGYANEAYIQQVGTSTSAEALQAGIANYIHLNQTGYNISTRIVQLGADNIYHGDIEGNEVSLDLVQIGYANTISQSSLMTSTGFTIIQEGDRNEIVQSGELANTMGIKIHQQGYGMKLIMKSN